ncbi:MAG: heme-binding domain-containing protein [Blastocatellia bacterium]
MKKIFKIGLILIVGTLFVMQFFRPNFSNPAIVEAETLRASTNVPADVANLLSRSCNDCHSNETIYPWYANISPFSWFLADHIEEGRHELNFSEWNKYETKKKIHKLEEICEVVGSKEMPLPSYLWIHRGSVLSDADKKLLCDWTEIERVKLAEN